ncbi:protein kinase family protein [Rhynchospora pubera]|nr:protein kinase family protein [Rhynchospora pubera]
MITAALPYSNLTWFGAVAEVREGKMPMMPEQLPNYCREFVQICLQKNPLNRPTASQLLHHPFIACANTNVPHSRRR